MGELRRVLVQVAQAAGEVRPLATPRAHGGLLLAARHPERPRPGAGSELGGRRAMVGQCAVQVAAAAYIDIVQLN
jgi:hypothetical protein